MYAYICALLGEERIVTATHYEGLSQIKIEAGKLLRVKTVFNP